MPAWPQPLRITRPRSPRLTTSAWSSRISGSALPCAVAQGLMPLEAGLELGRAVHFSGDQHRPVEQERRLALLDDREPHPLERRPARRRQLGRIEPREAHPAPVPELGMDHHRQLRASERSDQPLHPGHVVPVSVAEHDHLDVGRRDPEPAHVLDHPVRRHAGVEQQRSLAPGLLDPHQRREARLGDQRVGHAVAGDSPARARSEGRPSAPWAS